MIFIKFIIKVIKTFINKISCFKTSNIHICCSNRSNVFINDNNLLWLSNLIATALTTIVAYIAHSKITWKERHVTKAAIIRFFIWNALLAFLIAPSLTQLFGMLTVGAAHGVLAHSTSSMGITSMSGNSWFSPPMAQMKV